MLPPFGIFLLFLVSFGDLSGQWASILEVSYLHAVVASECSVLIVKGLSPQSVVIVQCNVIRQSLTQVYNFFYFIYIYPLFIFNFYLYVLSLEIIFNMKYYLQFDILKGNIQSSFDPMNHRTLISGRLANEISISPTSTYKTRAIL